MHICILIIYKYELPNKTFISIYGMHSNSCVRFPVCLLASAVFIHVMLARSHYIANKLCQVQGRVCGNQKWCQITLCRIDESTSCSLYNGTEVTKADRFQTLVVTRSHWWISVENVVLLVVGCTRRELTAVITSASHFCHLTTAHVTRPELKSCCFVPNKN